MRSTNSPFLLPEEERNEEETIGDEAAIDDWSFSNDVPRPPPMNPEFLDPNDVPRPPPRNPDFREEVREPNNDDDNEEADDHDDEEEDSHLFPPFESTIEHEHSVTKAQESETGTNKGGRFPSTVEVDPNTGTIRMELEDERGSQDSPSESEGSTAANQDATGRLTQYQKCWMIVFLRRWARQTKRYSKAALQKVQPRLQKTAKRSARYVRAQSVRMKTRVQDFNEKHEVTTKARRSAKLVGRKTKQASVAAGRGLQRASEKTVEHARAFEAKHDLLAKSKKGLKESKRVLRNAWRGKPLRHREQPPPSGNPTISEVTHDIANSRNDSVVEIHAVAVMIEEDAEPVVHKIPRASSE